MFMTYVESPGKDVLSLRYWHNGALIERTWQRLDDIPDWEPCSPAILRAVGTKGRLVKIFETVGTEL
jgi:hypothetical protein